MTKYFLVLLMGLMPMSFAHANMEALLETHLWTERVVVILAPSPEDAKLVEQKRLLQASQQGVDERDIVIWEAVDKRYVAKNFEIKPHIIAAQFYEHFNVSPNQYSVFLIGKDGEIKHQQDDVFAIEDLFGRIDAMPMRQREMNN